MSVESIKVLDDLLEFDEILACMVARRNMISILPTGGVDSFKPGARQVYRGVKNSMENLFLAMGENKGIKKLTMEINEYEVLMYVLPGTEVALVAIVPGLSNMGLIDVELERARQKIQKIKELEEKRKHEAAAASAPTGLTYG